MLQDFTDLKEHLAELRRPRDREHSVVYWGGADLDDQNDALRQVEVSLDFWARWVRTYLERTNICINLVGDLFVLYTWYIAPIHHATLTYFYLYWYATSKINI